MPDFTRPLAVLVLILLAATARADPVPPLVESKFWAQEVRAGDLPPVAERIPAEPLIVDLAAKGRLPGKQGGTLRTFVTRSKDVRQMVVYGYARLVGYDHEYRLKPDILRDLEIIEGRKFILHLRAGHKWSDGAPFTSADFEYWWKHVVSNPDLSPSGPAGFMRVEGQPPKASFPDPLTVIFEWDSPNPEFVQTLAQARPPFIYRPAHYLKRYHADFTDPASLAEEIAKRKVTGWAALHNKYDNMYKFNNADLPTLQPWMVATKEGKTRFQFVRNPYYHRIDRQGIQLPYIDVVSMHVVGPGLVAAKANAGETDLQARGLDFKDVAILKKGEKEGGNYRVFLWGSGIASQIAIYPNLNYADPAFRDLMRDVRFRRALSLGVDRRMINRALYFGLGKEGGLTVLPQSPFYREENRSAWAVYDPARANALLDEIGLTGRDAYGIRLLPDGRPVTLVVETAGERQEVENALQIIADTWADIGVRMIMRPLDRDILRNRVYSGQTMAAVWYGWDNGLPQSYTRPVYVVPQQQEFFAWPKWGQFYQTRGAAGEAPDLAPARRLMELAEDWARATDDAARAAAWQEMIDIHADQVFGIGILAEAPQPVVVNRRLRNVPEHAIWAWDPGAHFGVQRPDEFWFADSAGEGG